MPDHDAPDFSKRRASLDRIASALDVSPKFFDAEATVDLDLGLLLELWSAVTCVHARRRILNVAAEEARQCQRGKAE